MKRLFRDLSQVWLKSKKDLVLIQATALAYKSLVSLVPVMAVAFYFFKAFGGLNSLVDYIRPLIADNLVPESADQVMDYAFKFVDNIQAGAIGGVGFLLLVLTAVSTLSTIEDTFNLIWGIKKPRSMGQRVTAYWSVLTIGPVLLAVSLVLSGQALVWLKGDSGEVSKVLVLASRLVPYFASGLLLTTLYFFMPNTKVNFKDAAKAGAITGLVFEAAKVFYAQYAIKSVTNNPVYGSLAFLPVFLLWLYVVWVIVLLGAELCCYFQFRRLSIPFQTSIKEKLNPLILFDIIDEIERSQKNTKPGVSLSQILSFIKIPFDELANHILFLEKQGILALAQDKFHVVVNIDDERRKELIEALERQSYLPKSKKTLGLQKEYLRVFKESKE